MSYLDMHSAIDQGELEKIRFLLNNGTDVNIRDPFRNVPLHTAVHRFSEDPTELLDKQINWVEKESNYKIMCSSVDLKHEIEIVKLLFQQDADVNAENNYNQTPLHLAVTNVEMKICKPKSSFLNVKHNLLVQMNLPTYFFRKPNFNIIQILLANGAKVNAKDCNGLTPLHVAIGRDDVGSCVVLNILKLLIKHGADVNTQDKFGRAPLHYAIRLRNPLQIKSQLTNSELDISYTMSTAKKAEVLKLLIDNGADINIKAKDLSTPLGEALRANDTETIRILLKNFDYCSTGGRNPYTDIDDVEEHFLKHLIRLRKANLTDLKDAVYLSWKTEYNNKESSRKKFNWTNLELDCKEELKRMDLEFVDTLQKISYLDILIHSLHVCADLMSKNNIKKNIENIDFHQKFPQYADILQNKIEDIRDLA